MRYEETIGRSGEYLSVDPKKNIWHSTMENIQGIEFITTIISGDPTRAESWPLAQDRDERASLVPKERGREVEWV